MTTSHRTEGVPGSLLTAVDPEAVRALVDEVEFSCEDATRSDPAFVATVCRAAVEAGATTINLPDTVGYMLPAEYTSFFQQVRELCPELEQVALSAHCHDDLGLAVANSLAAVQAGVAVSRASSIVRIGP